MFIFLSLLHSSIISCLLMTKKDKSEVKNDTKCGVVREMVTSQAFPNTIGTGCPRFKMVMTSC